MGHRNSIRKNETKPFVEFDLWTGLTMIRVSVYTAADKKSSMVPKIFLKFFEKGRTQV